MTTVMDMETMSELERPSMPIRIGKTALEAVKIAAGFRGMTIGDYATLVLLESAERDIEAGYKNWSQTKTPKPKRLKGSE